MARWTPIPIVGGAYTDDVKPWSVQDCVNYIPVLAEKAGTRSPSMLRGVPGFVSFSSAMASAPVRGMHNVEGLLLAVAGNTLYRIGALGAATSLGTIPGVGRVTFAHNQVSGGNQVVIANGQSGYVYDTRNGTLVQITDDAFPGFKGVDFKDGYIIGVEPAGRYWFHSDLADALSYSSLDRQEAETAPDRIQLAIPTGDDVLVLGARTGQFFYNTGEAEGTFQNRDGTAFSVGAASPWCAANLDNTVYWLGDDGLVYRLAGYTPQRVSLHAIEQAISRCDISQAYAFTFEDSGHKVFYLTFPDGQTWGYDVATNEWHRRQSKGLTRWRVSALVRWNRRWVGGDYTNGKLYQLDWRLQREGDEPLERRRITGVIHDDENAIIVNGFRVVFDTGMDEESAPLPLPIDSVAITGDVPDGIVGVSASGTYTVTGGTTPYGAITVLSGTFPPGLTLDPDGSYSGDYTEEGLFSWVVGGEDADGAPFSVSDSATVVAALACSSEVNAGDSSEFQQDFPITLGAGTGLVYFDFDTYAAPDKIQLIYDGVTLFDSGYVGENTAAQQADLDSRLASEGLPSETIVGQGINQFSFNKVAASPASATVRVFSPGTSGADSQWSFRLGCPGAPATHQFRVAIMQDSPFSYWRFTEDEPGAGTFIDYGSNYVRLVPGGAGGSVTSGANPLYPDTDHAVTLNGVTGNLSPQGEANTGFRHTGSYTWVFALRFNALPGVGLSDCLLTAGNAGETEAANVVMQIGLNNVAGTFFWNLFHESGAGGNNTVNVEHPGITAGQEYLAHFVRDNAANEYRVYIDGALLGSGSFANDPTGGTTGLLTIGENGVTNTDNASVTLDEIAFFKSALSTVRISAHAAAILT